MEECMAQNQVPFDCRDGFDFCSKCYNQNELRTFLNSNLITSLIPFSQGNINGFNYSFISSGSGQPINFNEVFNFENKKAIDCISCSTSCAKKDLSAIILSNEICLHLTKPIRNSSFSSNSCLPKGFEIRP